MAAQRYSNDTIASAARMRERGMTFGQIGKKLGMSPSAVSWHCLRLGADSPNCQHNVARTKGPMEVKRGNHVVRRFTDAEDAELLRREAAGERISEIARALGRRHNSITGRLMTLARRQERQKLLEQAGKGAA